MLKSIYIQNYLLLDKLTLDFDAHFNVISGETGAGKSLLLEAMNLILGGRADRKMWKNQDKQCVIEAVFFLPKSQDFVSIIEKHNIAYNKEIILRREIKIDGNSRVFINDNLVSLQLLKQITRNWIHVHHQHLFLEMVEEKFRVNLMDQYGRNKALFSKYQQSFVKLKEIRQVYENKALEQKKILEQKEYINFQLEELEAIDWNYIENENLEERLSIINHQEEISKQLSIANQLLESDQVGCIAQLNKVKDSIKKISAHSTIYSQLQERLTEHIEEIKDISRDISNQYASLSFDTQEKERLEAIMSQVFKLQLKHNVSDIKELIKKKEFFQQDHQKIEKGLQDLESLQKNITQEELTLKQIAKELHQKRASTVLTLETKMMRLLKELALEKALFKITLQEKPFQQWNEYGADKIIFLFSSNPGIPVREVNEVASGGESSRLMLCLKSLLAEKESLPTMVFDEIDTGISGQTAIKVGNMLKSLGEKMQIISITHLPQIAARANYHIHIMKKTKNGKTFTQVKVLNHQQRIHEIAYMIGGQDSKDTLLEPAKELLENTKND